MQTRVPRAAAAQTGFGRPAMPISHQGKWEQKMAGLCLPSSSHYGQARWFLASAHSSYLSERSQVERMRENGYILTKDNIFSQMYLKPERTNPKEYTMYSGACGLGNGLKPQ
ncbi:hypothetical protein STEG23_010055 [Scotinomys teguina]